MGLFKDIVEGIVVVVEAFDKHDYEQEERDERYRRSLYTGHKEDGENFYEELNGAVDFIPHIGGDSANGCRTLPVADVGTSRGTRAPALRGYVGPMKGVTPLRGSERSPHDPESGQG